MPRSDGFAVLAGLYAGLAFGIFWLPIRAVEAAGFEGPWTMMVFSALPLLLCLPVAWVKRADYRYGNRGALYGGLLGGVAFSLYGAAFLYTDIIRAILLFYLMPVWGFFLAWAVAGDRLRWYRWVSIILGLAGLWVVFGRDAELPLPRNLGDWCGLASGFIWAVASLMILTDRRASAATHGVNFFGSATLFSFLIALLATHQGVIDHPDWWRLAEIAPWALPVALILILPAGFATVYAPTRLNPGVCGLLFMTEVGVAAVTAAIWANESLGVREVAGLLFVLGAGLLEPVVVVFRRRGPLPSQ